MDQAQYQKLEEIFFKALELSFSERAAFVAVECEGNAGLMGEAAPVPEIAPDTWREVLDVNLTGAFYGARHQIPAMSEIVHELANLGWSDAKISQELGMDADEVLRLKQINGLAELFGDRQFSQAWTVK